MGQATTMARPDIREYADRYPLDRLIEEDIGSTRVGRRYRCVFHDDHKPDLEYDRPSNRYRCWSCGARGDALDWLVNYRRMPYKDALRMIGVPVEDGDDWVGPTPPPLPPPRAKPVIRPAHFDPEWQRTVEEIIAEARNRLWSPEGEAAADWLNRRGIDDRTAERFNLGFIAGPARIGPFDVLRDRGGEPDIVLDRGILFPTLAPGSAFPHPIRGDAVTWGGGVIRRLNADVFDPSPPSWGGKCLALKGTDRSDLYPHPLVRRDQLPTVALLVEGEIDALIAEQAVGRKMIVATVGGANGRIGPRAAEQVARCRQVLIATDIDRAGINAYWHWRDLLPEDVQVAPGFLPRGKDIGEFVQHHNGSVVEWIVDRLNQLRWNPWHQA